jgi:glycosyltransferase involved in cell wall biosynthesis
VKNASDIAEKVVTIASIRNAELVLLSYEIWDLMNALQNALEQGRVPFAVFLHSTPFVDAPPRPSGNIYADIIRRLLNDRHWLVRLYLFKRFIQIPFLMKRLKIIVLSRTMKYYLHSYFPNSNPIESIPGYGNDFYDISLSSPQRKEYDLVFMSALEEGKGVFELPQIVRELKLRKRQIKLLIIGAFSSNGDRKKFMRLIKGLETNVVLTGWLDSPDKWIFIKKARVFLFPSIFSNTHSFPLLEALSCGLPAVCYDTPFVRLEFETSAVKTAPLRDIKGIANIVWQLLSNETELTELSQEAIRFASNFPSWGEVARAEIEAYDRIISHC